MTRLVTIRLLSSIVVAVALVVALQPSTGQYAAAAVTTATVKGNVTSWQVRLLKIHAFDRIPGTTWMMYEKHLFRFYVLTLQMTNTGTRAADPYDDLNLVMRVSTLPGWTALVRSRAPQGTIMETAAREFGGLSPWEMTQPGKANTYCYVIATKHDLAHFGLYNFVPAKGYIYLLDTGV